jgi:AcrR family transcriptional regulator
LVYHYFGSKDELLSAVFDRYSFLPALRSLLAVAPDRPATDVLPEIAAGFSALATERADLLRLVVRESQTNARVGEALGKVMAEGLDLLSSYLEGRVAAGELRPHDVTVTARAIFHAIVASHLGGAPPPGFGTDLADVILRGVLVPGVDRTTVGTTE